MKFIIKIFIALFFLTLSTTATAQEQEATEIGARLTKKERKAAEKRAKAEAKRIAKTNSARQANKYKSDAGLTTGDKNFEDLAYEQAIVSYLKQVEKGEQSEDLLKNLADSYYELADYTNAAKWYGQLYDTSDNLESDYIYRYAQSLKSDEQYLSSDKVMNAFYEATGQDKRANLFINERDYLEEIELNSGRFSYKLANFNSKLSDFAPAFYEGSVVFASNRVYRSSSKRIHDWNAQPFLDIYKVDNGLVEASSTSKFNSEINTVYHESTAVFTKDGKTMYFTRNNYTKKNYKEDQKGINRLKLYRATRNTDTSNDWAIQELPFNDNNYSVAHPALSPDEKTLYFASDMPGTKGLSDLYKVAIKGNQFGAIENLGDKINTEGRETFPFISKENRLFFASDGHVGLGGLDVFVSNLSNDKIGEIYNLGRPINSPEDDFTFIINSDTDQGFFASNRAGGVGDDDIYSFTRTKPLISCDQAIAGTVLNKNTGVVIPDTSVIIYNASNVEVSRFMSDSQGAFAYNSDCVKGTYRAVASKAGYTPESLTYTIDPEVKLDLALNLNLKPIPVATPVIVQPQPQPVVSEYFGLASVGTDLFVFLRLNNIYFDYDKSYIRPDAQRELETVIEYLNYYPSISVDVQSHTDSRGRDAYNESLSQRRNASTKKWIIDNGNISSSRITGRGYGETRLVNRCSNGVKCSDDEHQQNRRSMFIVTRN